ncbi:hypothetical protein LXL04_025175 [Taraxacum kok-saghyz]
MGKTLASPRGGQGFESRRVSIRGGHGLVFGSGFLDSAYYNACCSTSCLPAKKRICAFHPNLLPAKPISPFDLNLDYDPKLEDDNASVIVNVSEKREEIDDIGAEEEEDVNEDGILCAVCQSTDGDPSDPIVFCDGCDMMVHTTCYAIP